MAENDRGSGRQREWKLKKGMDAFGNMFGLNICFVVGCLPVFTIGASLAAAYAMAIRLQEGEEETIVSGFIHEFKRNFKQATLGFLGVLVVVAVLLAEWILVNTQTGALSLFYTIVFYLELLFLSLTLAFFFPMIARYHTTLKQAVKNSVLLSVGYVFSWIKITVAWVAPVVFSIVYPLIFFYTWYLWLILLFGAIIWGTSHTIRFVFKQNAEALKDSAEAAAEEEKKKEEERQQLENAKKLLEDNRKSQKKGSGGGRKRALEPEGAGETADTEEAADTDKKPAETAQEAPETKNPDRNRNSQSKSNQNRNDQNKNNQNRNNQNRNNQNKTVQNKNNQNKGGQNKNNQNKNSQNKGGQNNGNRNKGGQNKTAPKK